MKYNKEILNQFLLGNIPINVETEEEFNKFMELLVKETDRSFIFDNFSESVNKWNKHKENTCVVASFALDDYLALSPVKDLSGYPIVKYKDLIKGEETMTNIEKVNKALKNADESKVKEVLDFLGYKEDSKFIPEHGDKYYVMGYGEVGFNTWVNDEYDNHCLLMDNVYRTEEEAEQALDFQKRKAKLIKEIEDSSDVIEWGDGYQNKYYIWLDGRSGSLRVDGFIHVQIQGTIYTTNSRFLSELITTRADEVKELLFGIK